MEDFLAQLPSVILAQGLGVALALGVDALSWKWRRDENAVFGWNLLNLIFMLTFALPFVVATLSSISETKWIMQVLALAMLWLSIGARVQSRQMKTTFRAAFYGALMQLGCFGWALFISLFLLFVPILFARGFEGFYFYKVYLLSAVLFYALMSLFRPTIYGAWNAMRGNFTRK